MENGSLEAANNDVLWEEHRKSYKLIAKNGVTIFRGKRPNYIMERNGIRFVRSIDMLVAEGFAKLIYI